MDVLIEAYWFLVFQSDKSASISILMYRVHSDVPIKFNGVTLHSTQALSAACFFERTQSREGARVGALERWGDLPIRVFLSRGIAADNPG